MKFVRLGSACAIAMMISGCQIFRTGGMPEASFSIETDVEKLATEFHSATDISEFYKTPSQETRDRFLTGRLVLIDLRYLQFIRTMTSDKQQLDSATDLATLSLNLAGTLVGGARSKANLAAAAAGLGGAKTSVDKHFYYEQSVNALVATMNAKRKEVLTRILQSIGSDLTTYPFTQAVTDAHDYYMAGTVNGALTFIQSEANRREGESDKQLEELKIVRDVALLPLTDRVTKRHLSMSLSASDLTLAAANKTLIELGYDEQKLPNDLEKSKAILQEYVRQARTVDAINQVRDAFDKTNILKTK